MCESEKDQSPQPLTSNNLYYPQCTARNIDLFFHPNLIARLKCQQNFQFQAKNLPTLVPRLSPLRRGLAGRAWERG